MWFNCLRSELCTAGSAVKRRARNVSRKLPPVSTRLAGHFQVPLCQSVGRPWDVNMVLNVRKNIPIGLRFRKMLTN